MIRKPWAGRRWQETGLLVLGESLYCRPGEDPEDPDRIVAVVREVIGGARIRFFTAVERAVTGRGRGETRPAEFWPMVAFANFCQGAADGPAGIKTPVMWRRGTAALPILLDALRPRHMLLFSTASWRRLHRLRGLTFRHERTIAIGGRTRDVCLLERDDGAVRIRCMNLGHSNSRNWGVASDWHPFVDAFLDRAAEHGVSTP